MFPSGRPGNDIVLLMSKKLSESNPYLRDPEIRKKSLWISVKSSSAIEGIHHPFAKDGSLMVSHFSSTSRIAAKSHKPQRGK